MDGNALELNTVLGKIPQIEKHSSIVYGRDDMIADTDAEKDGAGTRKKNHGKDTARSKVPMPLPGRLAVKTFTVKLPEGMITSVPLRDDVALQDVMEKILRQKPHLTREGLGAVLSMTGEELDPAVSLADLKATEVLWGTTAVRWRVVREIERVADFLQEEASNNKIFKIYLPHGHVSSIIYDADKTVSEVLERLTSTRDDLLMDQYEAYDLKGNTLSLDWKLSEIEEHAFSFGTDIISWIEHKEKTQERSEVTTDTSVGKKSSASTPRKFTGRNPNRLSLVGKLPDKKRNLKDSRGPLSPKGARPKSPKGKKEKIHESVGITQWDTLDLDALGEDELSHEIATSRVQPSHWHLKHAVLMDGELFEQFLRDEEGFTADHMVPYHWLPPSVGDKAFDDDADAFNNDESQSSGEFEGWQQTMAKLVNDRRLEYENVAVTFAGTPS
eukprot:TRINITY_DN8710_c0_g1_i1.p1 TRINITY_DN8710_c0_g1~~TRINITY_DN8710_c0_g1_i1.p1  ORF type:complete len:476 (+),score=108.55 TRINITY_DN8710_c0_g1_i1:100-1428(+)